MRMPADEKLCIMSNDFLFHTGCVPPGISTDMLHKHTDVFAIKKEFLSKLICNIRGIDVAVNSF